MGQSSKPRSVPECLHTGALIDPGKVRSFRAKPKFKMRAKPQRTQRIWRAHSPLTTHHSPIASRANYPRTQVAIRHSRFTI